MENPKKSSKVAKKVFNCETCGRKFANKFHVERHIADVHLATRPYTCQTCSATFKRWEHLQIHLSAHTSDKPHKCQRCEKKYKHKCHLKRHVNNAHGGVASAADAETNRRDSSEMASDYELPVVTRQPAKHQHYLRSTGRHQGAAGELYPCTYCDETFSSESQYDAHRIRHGDFYVTPSGELRFSYDRPAR